MDPVLITTHARGVFFGYLATPGDDASPAHITLQSARNAVYWDMGVRGFLGLASGGPGPACRIGPAVPSLTLYGVSGVVACTLEAAAAWELAPWADETP